MADTVLRADATFGLKVKVGDTIRPLEKIGSTGGNRCPVTSPVSGIVESISFDPDSHEFVVVISPGK